MGSRDPRWPRSRHRGLAPAGLNRRKDRDQCRHQPIRASGRGSRSRQDACDACRTVVVRRGDGVRTITMLSRTPLGLASPPFPITWRRLRVFQNNANTRARFAPETSGTKGDPEA